MESDLVNYVRFWNITVIIWKLKNGTSHRNFINAKGDVITIKEENPLKAVYVKDVLKRIGEYNNWGRRYNEKSKRLFRFTI